MAAREVAKISTSSRMAVRVRSSPSADDAAGRAGFVDFSVERREAVAEGDDDEESVAESAERSSLAAALLLVTTMAAIIVRYKRKIATVILSYRSFGCRIDQVTASYS